MANCTMCIKFDECPWRSDPNSLCSAYEQRAMTNAERIRAMTDDELAEFIGKVTAGGYGVCAPGHYDCTGKDSCAPCWLDWLKQECE